MKQRAKRLRDAWQKVSNCSYFFVALSRQSFRAEAQHHIASYQHLPLQERICNRAELWTNPTTRHAFGYGNGNRAKRRAYRLWQAARITAAQMEAAYVRPLHMA